jgi:pyruvyl transferase EpsO
LLRTDQEQRGYDQSAFAQLSDSLIDDWLEEPVWPLRLAHYETRIRQKLSGPRGAQALQFRLFQRLAKIRLARGLDLLARGRTVVTDRLHAHILSFMMDIPHVALDNDYGKVSSFIEAWTSASPSVQTATNPGEALSARELL